MHNLDGGAFESQIAISRWFVSSLAGMSSSAHTRDATHYTTPPAGFLQMFWPQTVTTSEGITRHFLACCVRHESRCQMPITVKTRSKNPRARPSAQIFCIFLWQTNLIHCYISHKYFWSQNFSRRDVQKCCGYWITLTRNARSGRVCSSHCYLDRRQLHEIATFDEIVMTKTFSTIDCIIKSNF